MPSLGRYMFMTNTATTTMRMALTRTPVTLTRMPVTIMLLLLSVRRPEMLRAIAANRLRTTYPETAMTMGCSGRWSPLTTAIVLPSNAAVR